MNTPTPSPEAKDKLPEVDTDKISKLGAAARDFFFMFASTLYAPFAPISKKGDGTADTTLTADNPKTWVFMFFCAALGGIVLHGAAGTDLTLSFASVGTIIWSISLAFVFATGLHFVAWFWRSGATFMDNLGVCMRVIPSTFFVATLITMTFAKIASWFFDTRIPSDTAYVILGASETLLLLFYLPMGLQRAHALRMMIILAVLTPGSATVLAVITVKREQPTLTVRQAVNIVVERAATTLTSITRPGDRRSEIEHIDEFAEMVRRSRRPYSSIFPGPWCDDGGHGIQLFVRDTPSPNINEVEWSLSVRGDGYFLEEKTELVVPDAVRLVFNTNSWRGIAVVIQVSDWPDPSISGTRGGRHLTFRRCFSPY